VIIVVFLFALAIRVVFLAGGADPVMFGKYPYFAEKLVNGQDLGERVLDMSPGYLYFSAFFFRIAGNDWGLLRGLQSAAGAMVGVLILLSGSRRFNPGAGLMAALLYAGCGTIVIHEATLEPVILILLFNLLTIMALDTVGGDRVDPDRPDRWAIVGCGLLAGVSLVIKADFLLFLPAGLLWLAGPLQGRRPLNIFRPVLFVTAALAVVSPVTIRNYIKFNDFVLLTADAGKVFYHGNGKGATALNWTGLADEGFREEGAPEPDYAHVLFRRSAEAMTGRPLKPSQASRFWINQAMRDMLAEPAVAAKRLWEKLCFFFNDYELTYIATTYKELQFTRARPFVRFGWIAAFSLVGMILAADRFRRLWLIYAMVGVGLVSCLLFITQSRYRAPVLPYLCLFAGYALDRIGRWLMQKQIKPAALALTGVVVLAMGSFFAFKQSIAVIDRWQTATKIHYQLEGLPFFAAGKYVQALDAVDRCLALEPDFAPAHNLKGKVLAVLGRFDEARQAFRAAIRLSPSVPAGYENLGLLYLLQGDTAQALSWLKHAAEKGSYNPKVDRAIADLEAR
jgi:tetratricopeptide (TPR) repeat protein